MAGKMGHRIMAFMSKRMIACDEASFLVSYKNDHRLGLKKWWKLKMHLLSCHLCRKYAHQIDQLINAVDQYRESCNEESCSHHLSDDASARMQHALQSELNAK